MIEYDLSELANADTVVEPPEEAESDALEYTLLLALLLRSLKKETVTTVLPVFNTESVEYAIQRLRLFGGALVQKIIDKMEPVLIRATGRHSKKFIAAVRKATRLDLSAIIRNTDTDDLVRLYIKQNAVLLKSLTDDMIGVVEKEVYAAAIAGTTEKELGEKLAARFDGMKRGRADLIARDQLSKLNADLTMLRYKQAGASEYIWDYRPGIPRKTRREHHVARHKKVFAIGEPSGDQPGHAINCKCKARMAVKK